MIKKKAAAVGTPGMSQAGDAYKETQIEAIGLAWVGGGQRRWCLVLQLTIC